MGGSQREQSELNMETQRKWGRGQFRPRSLVSGSEDVHMQSIPEDHLVHAADALRSR